MTAPCGYEREFIAEFYDYVPLYESHQSADFYVGLARDCGGPVLELGCGTGRILIPTAREGIAITGVDLSTHMLHICRQKLSQETRDVQARVELFHGDITDFELDDEFKLVTIPFRPLQHLVTPREQLACLSVAHRRLGRGGRLAVDVFSPNLELLTDESGTERDEGQPFEMPV